MLGPHPRDSPLGPPSGTKTEDRARESRRGIRRGGRISLGIVMHTALARNNAGPLSLMRPSCFLPRPRHDRFCPLHPRCDRFYNWLHWNFHYFDAVTNIIRDLRILEKFQTTRIFLNVLGFVLGFFKFEISTLRGFYLDVCLY